MKALQMPGPRILSCVAALLCLLLADSAVAGDGPVTLRLTPARVKQGGVAMLEIGGAHAAGRWRLRVGNREIPLVPPGADGSRVVWIGVDLAQPPGPFEVIVDGVSLAGERSSAGAVLLVADGAFPVQRLSVPRSFTELDAATLERVDREKALLDKLWSTATPARLWRGPFRSPLQAVGGGTGFGLRRIINGDPRAPHTGVDFSVPAGTPIFAANTGQVVLAAEHFFAGKSLVLDHGEGLYTMYFHLQDSLVQPGQRVASGEAIGRVGSSGRATGPHLHWGARLYGARINPEELLKLPPE